MWIDLNNIFLFHVCSGPAQFKQQKRRRITKQCNQTFILEPVYPAQADYYMSAEMQPFLPSRLFRYS